MHSGDSRSNAQVGKYISDVGLGEDWMRTPKTLVKWKLTWVDFRGVFKHWRRKCPRLRIQEKSHRREDIAGEGNMNNVRRQESGSSNTKAF